MCLEYLKDFELPEVFTGYKLVHTDGRSEIFGYAFEEGENLAECNDVTTSDDEKKYEAGFHVFLDKKDAANLCSRYYLCKNTMIIPVIVKRKDVTATGIESLWSPDDCLKTAPPEEARVAVCRKLTIDRSTFKKFGKRIPTTPPGPPSFHPVIG